jgi:hypothetical protein
VTMDILRICDGPGGQEKNREGSSPVHGLQKVSHVVRHVMPLLF